MRNEGQQLVFILSLFVSSCDDIDLVIGQFLPANLIIPRRRSGESRN